MKYYTSTTEFNCGIDLHARQMYVCVMDRQGNKRVHTNVKDNDFKFFLKLIEPYKHDLTVCCECMFGWYWLADACQAAGLTFVLAHALYVKAIHGGKNKNDRIDSEKLTHLLRSNLIRRPTSIRLTNGRCVRCCVSASSTSGAGPNCWLASTPINWRTTAFPPGRLGARAIPGRNNCWRPKTIPCARSL
ncbi:MAG: hypothetical protein DME22_23020 [Verrucomicrobia bacterium]|nr:MAG: hypothetical protein DME22_23020 [Verrucomicrobiota bacterium]